MSQIDTREGRRPTVRGVVLVAVAAMVLAVTASTGHAASGPGAPHSSRADYQATGLAGHPAPIGGGVLDVTFGRERGALEVHRIAGAAPATAYGVVAEIFFATECQPDDPFGPLPVEEGVLETDDGGSGSFVIRFPGEALAGAPDAFWVRWSLVVDEGPAYRSGCVQVLLGP